LRRQNSGLEKEMNFGRKSKVLRLYEQGIPARGSSASSKIQIPIFEDSVP
jgi:hypothetical protein